MTEAVRNAEGTRVDGFVKWNPHDFVTIKPAPGDDR